ncbi:MAG: alpha/beta hydrolase family protein [Puniceicoccaceae bacterium]
MQMLNNMGNLTRVRETETLELEGFRIDAGFLEFTARDGRTCSVYAERCLLDREQGPAVIHCPGGGQTVDRADLLDWARKGFSSVSFDWQIGDYPGHDPAKKSRWPKGVVTQIHYIRDASEAILPLAVQAAGACVDWLIESDKVNTEAIGVVGISWGGFLTWLVAAYEPRIKAAVPVYGCGGQFDERYPGRFRLPPAMRDAWINNWDPYSIAARQSKPVCYLSCTNDFFGILPLANELLNKLTVPRRRGWLPNCNHSIGPGESALGLAWLRHYLDNGPALPSEPVLKDDFTLEADAPEDILSSEIWWTPELKDGDLGCWIKGTPEGTFAAAYGRVHYKQGYTLSTPLKSQSQSQSQSHLPTLRDGLGWNWGMGSTQFHTNHVTVENLSEDTVLLHRDPDKKDDAPSFFLNQFAHPEWNAGIGKAVTIGLRTDPPEPLSEATVTLSIRGIGGRQELSATIPIENDAIRIRLDEFPGFGPMHTWGSVVRVQIQLKTTTKRFQVGPLERE